MGTGASKDAASSNKSGDAPNKNEPSTSKLSQSQNKGVAEVVSIALTRAGFSQSEITVSAGQVITFNWSASAGGPNHNIRQVVFDGQTAHLVRGGFHSGPPIPDGSYEIHFNLQGEFKFISDGYDTNSSKIFNVNVKTQKCIMAQLTEEEFNPSIVHIPQGQVVKWVWNSLHEPSAIQEVQLCSRHSGIIKSTGGEPTPLQSGSYQREFTEPGLFYFQTSGTANDDSKLCIVLVEAAQQHHAIEVTDRVLQPRVLTISQGDQVWWIWDRFKCKKKHRIQQVELPSGQSTDDPSLQLVKGGFSSGSPCRAGMLSHCFTEPGVYYFCDNYEESQDNIGVVIVNSIAKQHQVEVTSNGFYPDLSMINSGDRVWWTWALDSVQDIFSVLLVDNCVASDGRTASETDCSGQCKYLSQQMAGMLTDVGVATIQLNRPGAYTFRVSDTFVEVGCYSVIVSPSPKNHCITVSDQGFEPKVLNVHPGDSVCWMWENTKNKHSISQVSGQGHPVRDGFRSGPAQLSPAAFVHQAMAEGVLYYQSEALAKLCGAVVVVPQPQVRTALVSLDQLEPDPVLAQRGDCVAWIWPSLRKHGLKQLASVDQIPELVTDKHDVVTPRRCCALRFSNPGVYHCFSKSFYDKPDQIMNEPRSKTVLSSVVVSNTKGPMTVSVSSKGFKPLSVSIRRGEVVMWSWKGSQLETHNIIHANPPAHEHPYSRVGGPRAFTSGEPEPNGCYRHTFEEAGSFYATSEGAPGCVSLVHVLNSESLTLMPEIVSESNGGVVDCNHSVQLQATSKDATILYTLDGTIPELQASSTKVLKPGKPISLHTPGLQIIRAVAVGSRTLPSDVFTTKRFWILEPDDGDNGGADVDSSSVTTEDLEAAEERNTAEPMKKWQWWNCAPSITGWQCSSSDSSIEVYWMLPIMPYREQLKLYQLYVNGICYHKRLPPTCNSIIVEGMTGNQTFIISIVGQSKDPSQLQLESNKLILTSPTIFELGGPILSFETTDRDDIVNLVWTSLDHLYDKAVTYRIFLNGDQLSGPVQTVGDYENYPLALSPRDGKPSRISVFILALPGGATEVSEGFLSNQLDIDVHRSLGNVSVPHGGSLVGKPLLIIKEGSGNPPDPRVKRLPSVEQAESSDGTDSKESDGTPEHESPKKAQECSNAPLPALHEAPEENENDNDTPAEDKPEAQSVSDACLQANPKPFGSQNTDEPDPTESQNTEPDPTESQNTEPDPTESQNTEPDPTESQNTEPDPTESQNSEPDPNETQNTEPDPTESQNTEPDPTESQNTEPDPTESQNTEPDPTESQNTMPDTTESQNTEPDPIESQNTDEPDTTESQNTEPDPTESQNTEPDPTESQNTEPDPNGAQNTDPRDLHASPSAESSPSVSHDAACVSQSSVSGVAVHNGAGSVHVSDAGFSSCVDEGIIKASPSSGDSEKDGTLSMQNGESDGSDHTTNQEEVSLPKPVVSVHSQATVAELRISWQTAAISHPSYTLHHYDVCVSGKKFDSSMSSHSHQDVQTDSGETESEHKWNAGKGRTLTPSGLVDSTVYRVTVQATFHHQQKAKGQQGQVQTSSEPVDSITGGKPQPPRLWVQSVGLQEVSLAWEPAPCHQDIQVTGYQVTHDGKPISELVPHGETEKTVKKLQPDSKHLFTVSLVTSNAGQSRASNFVTVNCPEVPDTPEIEQESSTQEETPVIVWKRQKNKGLSSYRVFADGKLHGEVKAKSAKKATHQKYLLSDLKSENCQCKITVKACSGGSPLKKGNTTQFTCSVLSAESNSLTIGCDPPPPVSLDLRLSAIHADGVDLTWAVPDANLAAEVRGFVLIVKGQPHSDNVLPPSLTHATLSDLSLGSTLSVQVLAVTQPLTLEGSDEEPTTSDAIDEALRRLPQESVVLSGTVQVTYDHLVQAPAKVWCELVTGCSAMVVWEKGGTPKKHYVKADSYNVTWWELSRKSGEAPLSKMTSEDHLLINGLELGTKYCITVRAQASHRQPHGQIVEESSTDSDRDTYCVPVLSNTESITMTTASPPEPPSELAVASVAASSVHLQWRSPLEKGSEVTALRIYVTMESNGSEQTVQCLDLLPDATSAVIKHLQEAETYAVHLVTVTEEFFDSSDASGQATLPKDWTQVPRDCAWLPCISVAATTVGVTPPSNLGFSFDGEDAATLTWEAPACEPEAVKKYEVQWAEAKDDNVGAESDAHQALEVCGGTTSCQISGLAGGKTYGATVVAVVARPTGAPTKPRAKKKSKGKGKGRAQAKETLTRLASEPLTLRIPAPCEEPTIILAGFGPSWLDLYWEKLGLVTLQKNRDDGNCSSLLRRMLVGYKLMVNGDTYACLKHSTQHYTVQCSPGQTQHICLEAVTTTDRAVGRKLRKGHNQQGQDLAELESQCDKACSNTLSITLPKQQSGSITQLTAKYCPSNESQSRETGENNDLQGDIRLAWALQDCGTAEEQGIVGYNITWSNDVQNEDREATVPHTADTYDIPIYQSRCTYKVNLHASQQDDMWEGEPLPSVQCIVPGPPDPPALCCTSVTPEEFILEWAEPKLYGGMAVRGFQVYMNDKKIGQELGASHYKAAIPCRPNRTYRMSIVALSADPKHRDSEPSEEATITCWSEGTASQAAAKQGTGGALPARYTGQGDANGLGPAGPEDIAIGVADLSETVIGLEWKLPLIGLESRELVDRIKVSWSSVTKPKELEASLKSTATQYTIKGCAAGTNHFVVVTAVDAGDDVLHRSRQLTVQTTASLGTPHLRIRSCTHSGCILEWDKPTEFGNSRLTGYQLRLNGKEHDKLPAGATTYLFTSGKMCKEYNFTMQALCNIPHLNSQCSQPAIVNWPGVVPPIPERTATTKLNAIKVSWPEPKVTGGATVECFRVMCMEETGPKATPVQRRQPPKTVGPLPPEQRSAEFAQLSPRAAYTVLLETQLSGVSKAVRSRPMGMQYVARRPVSPSVRLRVRGLEERQALESEACQLINTRHRLLQELISFRQSLASLPPSQMESEDHEAEISDALSALGEMEEQLFQVLETLIPYTGTMEVDIDWEAVPANKDVQLAGYKVLVNGKQHGFLLHSHIDHICLQLSAYDGLHKISVVAVTEHAVGDSDPSDVIAVDASPFLPFTCYCLHSVHQRDIRHPQEGSCSYQQTLALELTPDNSDLLAGVHQQLHNGSRRIPPASVTVMDVQDRAPHLLVPTKLTNRCPTVLLFWTPWCLASQKTMDYFVDYAKNRARKLIFSACCCNSSEAGSSDHLQTLVQLLEERCWRDDDIVRHSCSCSSNNVGLMPGSRAGSASTERGEEARADSGKGQTAVSVAELFGILATPTIIILHPEGYLAWQGCHAATDSASFTTMMDETIESVAKTSRLNSPHSNSLKLGSLTSVSSLPPHQGGAYQRSETRGARPPSTNSSASSTSSRSSQSGAAARRGRRERKAMISVNNRPFSASKGDSVAKSRPKSSVTI